MYYVYNIAVHLASHALALMAFFHKKIRLFMQGRRETFPYLEAGLKEEKPVIWIHAASLGEFEQGLPVIEKLRIDHPEHTLLVTFFSPSGYEVRKNSRAADLICYLPLDTAANARKFVNIVQPRLAIFIKYEIWPGLLRELQRHDIPVLLISAIFKKNQIYFRWYGGLMREALANVTHFFVQNKESAALLRTLGIARSTLSGDTRFDRVSEIRSRDNSLDFMQTFKRERSCLVAGSTWPADEKILIPYINSTTNPLQFVIAPHKMDPEHIKTLRLSIEKTSVLYSELRQGEPNPFQVLIIDSIGLLTKIYSYADIAFVGGGFVTGLHNTLEPAVFGIPVIIGPRYSSFREAVDMVEIKGLFPVQDAVEFREVMDRLVEEPHAASMAGARNAGYIDDNKGATAQIMDYIQTLLKGTT